VSHLFCNSMATVETSVREGKTGKRSLGLLGGVVRGGIAPSCIPPSQVSKGAIPGITA
jgi:hypothetical protein